MACRLSFVVCVFDFEIFAAEKSNGHKKWRENVDGFLAATSPLAHLNSTMAIVFALLFRVIIKIRGAASHHRRLLACGFWRACCSSARVEGAAMARRKKA